MEKTELIKQTEEFLKKVSAFAGHKESDKKKACRHINCSSCDGCG